MGMSLTADPRGFTVWHVHCVYRLTYANCSLSLHLAAMPETRAIAIAYLSVYLKLYRG